MPRMIPPAKTVYLKTMGCQMNVYDSGRMISLLSERGFEVSRVAETADVIILNTCSVREKAEQKVLSLLGELKPLKARYPQKVIGVAGCVGQRLGKTLLGKSPHVDFVIGPDAVERVADLVEAALQGARQVVETCWEDGKREYSQPAVLKKSKPSEFLTVVKGCDQFCSYCIVPFVRGREKSRSPSEIMTDIRRLVDGGTQEVVLLGQNINTYGKGTPHRLATLVEEANRVSGLKRIRYVTSHPRYLDEELIRQFGRIEKLCSSLHLPVQSGSNRVLERMGRRYTREEFLEKVRLLQDADPSIGLSTDIIVGFPGETEEDFRQTLELMEQVTWAQAFLFKYSPRPGTRAYEKYHGEELTEQVKEERLARLQERVFAAIAKSNEGMVGKITPVLVDSLDKKGKHYTGRNSQGKVVHILDAGPDLFGRIVDVRIAEGRVSNLKGYLAKESS